jgi:zinc protease
LNEIRTIQKNLVSSDELRSAQNYLTGSFVFKFETMFQIASFMVAVHLYGLGLDYPSRFPELIGGVTREDIRDVARKYIDPENYTLVEVLPE